MRLKKALFVICILFQAFPASGAAVFLPDDEFTLPPFLYAITDNSGESETQMIITALDQKKREAHTGEWLDFGDSVDLARSRSIEIIQRENLMWVAGGVFQGKIGSGLHVKDDLIYDLRVKRGWIRVFIKPDSDHPKVQIDTEQGSFTSTEGEFWISTRPDQTELYVLKGEVRAEAFHLPFVNRSYAIFEKGKDKPRYIAKDWDPSSIEVKLAASYPGLVKLSQQAVSDWNSSKTAKTYSTYRKKGWRKASRLDPHSK